MAIKCLNNYTNTARSTLLRKEHGEEYTFPLDHPHWALSTIYNAWLGIGGNIVGWGLLF